MRKRVLCTVYTVIHALKLCVGACDIAGGPRGDKSHITFSDTDDVPDGPDAQLDVLEVKIKDGSLGITVDCRGLKNGITVEISTLDRVVDLCTRVPGCLQGITGDLLADILTVLTHVSIPNGDRRTLFFKNLAAKTLLNNPYLKEVLERRDFTVPEREVSAVAARTYVQLLRGFVNTLGMEIRVQGRAVAICAATPADTGQEIFQGICSLGAVEGIQVCKTAERLLRRRDFWRTLRWFLGVMRVPWLSLSGCSLEYNDINEIADMELTQLDMAGCGLKEESLSPLASDSSAIRGTLQSLNVANNLIGMVDIIVISKLALVELDLSNGYHIQRGSFVLLAIEDKPLVKSLRRLNISTSDLGMQDTEAITRLELTELTMQRCKLALGSFSYIPDIVSSTTRTLRKLDVSYNELEHADIVVLADLRLVELSLRSCLSTKGSLSRLVDPETVLKISLRRMDVGWNGLGPKDMLALSKMELESLAIDMCSLPDDGLAAFGGSNALRANLRRLNVASNKLTLADMAVISRMGLTELNITGCTIPRDGFAPFERADSLLRTTLCKLEYSVGSLSAEDRAALSKMSNLQLGAEKK